MNDAKVRLNKDIFCHFFFGSSKEDSFITECNKMYKNLKETPKSVVELKRTIFRRLGQVIFICG